jgi:hypothetical protein
MKICRLVVYIVAAETLPQCFKELHRALSILAITEEIAFYFP